MDKILPNTTQVPNVILDQWLPRLKDVELRVLLIIIRQTLGWIEDYETGRRKEKDWISRGQLMKKTGRGHSSVSVAVEKLARSGIIEAYDGAGNLLDSPKERSGNKVLYRLNLNPLQKSLFPVDKPVQKVDRSGQPVQNLDVQKVDTTKETLNTKEIYMRKPHGVFVKFWHETARAVRGIDPIITGKDGRNLKRVLDLGIQESTLEQAALYFLCNYSFQKFSPSISTFLSAGIINGLLNRMKNDGDFWRHLDGYSQRLKLPTPLPNERSMATELQKLKANLFKVPA